MYFGVDYYPEHWPKERWAIDARLMKETGINVVRLAEFAWAKMEPQLGDYHFEWLDEAIEILGKEGIKVVLGTPTPTPPIWIIEQNPEILPVNLDGTRLGFGGRHHCCQSNETYRNHIRRFVREMAGHYSNNPHVIGWQTDNEFGNSHQRLCACSSCRASFHKWLESKYKTIDELNKAWGTVFWSQTYSRFDQIPAPLPTPNSHNPSLLLDWKRFCSDLIVDFQKLQVDILREVCPNHFITHNFMGLFDKTDYFNLAKDLDFISHDQYPMHFRPERDPLSPPQNLAMALDLMRGMKQKAFWIMEQQAGHSGWELVSPAPRPGQLRLWTYQSVSHGADTVVYFRWRTCLFGTEEYWHGILPHSGIPGRRYAEIKKTIQELTPVMKECKGMLPGAGAAILFSYDQEWALQIQPHHPQLNYIKHLQGYYKALFDAHIPVDIISDKEDFSRYKLLVAPLQFLMTPELSTKFKDYVSRGGHLVLTMRTAVKNWNNTVIPEELPGDLSELLGIGIHDYDCLREIEQSVKWMPGDAAITSESANKWCDIITLDGAKALAVYEKDYYSGTPAITCNSYKNGLAYYVGTEPGTSIMEKFMHEAVKTAGLSPVMRTPKGVEATIRQDRDTAFIFILNHNAYAVSFEIPKEWQAVTGKEFPKDGFVSLPPFETAVFKSGRNL